MSSSPPLFKIDVKPLKECFVAVVKRIDRRALERRFKGPTEEISLRLAQAYIEDELAKHDRKQWGIRRRRAGRRRQAAFRAAEKAHSP